MVSPYDPKTLQEAVIYFADFENCREYLVARRWPNGVICPTCGSDRVSYLASVRRWQCTAHHAQRQFTLKTGTIMEDSPIGVDKWMVALWLVLNCKNGISSYEIGRALGMSQKSAWHLMHRARYAVHGGPVDKITGHRRSGRILYRRQGSFHAQGPESQSAQGSDARERSCVRVVGS